MIIALYIIVSISFLALLHTYLLYPLLLKGLAKGKSLPIIASEKIDAHFVSIIIAVHNEEKVIIDKLKSILLSDFPKEQYAVYIGSDCSTDNSNLLLETFCQDQPNFHLSLFTERQGKIGVVNNLTRSIFKLRPKSEEHLLLFTDANVMLTETLISRLTRHFQKNEIAIVDSNIKSIGVHSADISASEDTYISNEVLLKHHESLVWQIMMGTFGGCYCIRSNYFERVPENFLVDDFFITMKALEKGGQVINDLNAICYEAVSHDLVEEYKRKSRISAGNFQNLNYFKSILFRQPWKLAFAFLSHKVLRWLGPLFLIAIVIGSGILTYLQNTYALFLFCTMIVLLLVIPIGDLFLRKLGIKIGWSQNVRYFVMMNIALLEGFFKYLKGIKENVWQPPKRV